MLAVVCLGLRASAGPPGSADEHAAAPTGFPGAYLSMISKALEADPAYGSRLLDSFELHLRIVAAMTSSYAVVDYFEVSVLGAGESSRAELKNKLGSKPMETQRAAALLLAHAIARPEQFHEMLEGMEARKAGLGKNAAVLMRELKGAGDKRMINALRAQGNKDPGPAALIAKRYAKLNKLFDGPVDAQPEKSKESPPSRTRAIAPAQ
jgi:hypothetical protein